MSSMSKAKTYSYLAGALLAAALLLCSCSDDTVQEELEDLQTETVQVSLRIQTRATTHDGYEAGIGYENYINIAGGDYRIYFFDADNHYLTTFEPESFVWDDDDKTVYSMSGRVELSSFDQDDFKIVMLANWGGGYPSDIDESWTIDDICTAECAQFNSFSSFTLSEDNLIPFFGVHEYQGYKFIRDLTTVLDEPLTLLRAVAKVEVILEANDDEAYEDANFEYIRLYRYNSKGYCAPFGVYKQDDYDHDYTWNLDFVDDLHLLGDANDEDTEDKYVDMLQSEESSDGIVGKWIAYVPEYDNTSSEDDYSYIEVKLNYKKYDETDHIYFTQYDSNGLPDMTAMYDIHRNYLYRFRVSLVDGYLRIRTEDWENTFDNVFEFEDQ
ncbi:MAG: hypothetical protein LUC33_03180 [Prevotellaceae bacterium]|nr:hypothetical protein [Prevotellaceae bacterium]